MKGKLVITLLTILIIVLGVVAYLFSSNTLVSSNKFENEITKVETTSDSTEIEDIEKDLNETDLDSLDAELSDIEDELSI